MGLISSREISISENQKGMTPMTAIVYFSRAGENLINGKTTRLETGNTQLLAQMLAQILTEQDDTRHVSLHALTALHTYPDSYEETLERARRENTTAIAPISLPESEKTLLLGYPVWWGSLPAPVETYLESTDLSGKNLMPFCTHEGSRFGRTITQIAQLQKNARVLEGLPVRGSAVRQAEQAARNWLLSHAGILANSSV
jgi:flavodoxin